MIFAHQIALDLTQDQEAYCRRAAGTARFAYNWALAEWKRQYQAGEKPTAAQLKKQWNAIKHERYPWVDEVHKDANQRPFTNLGTALSKFFRHEAQYPRFKKKGRYDSFYISNDQCSVVHLIESSIACRERRPPTPPTRSSVATASSHG